MGTRKLAVAAFVTPMLACSDFDDCRGEAPPDSSYAETLDEWLGPVREDGTREGCSNPLGGIVEGACSSGKRFLYYPYVFGVQVRYFDAEDRVVAAAGYGDIVIDHCDGAWFTPSRRAVRCGGATGRFVCTGEDVPSVSLPFDDGEP